MTETVIKLNKMALPIVMRLPEAEEKLDRMYQAIDCDCVGIGGFKYLNERFGEKYCVVYDEEALLKPNYINIIASYLYGTGDHGQFICGDVLIMKNEFTDEGIETVGLDPQDVMALSPFLVEIRQHAYEVVDKAFKAQ